MLPIFTEYLQFLKDKTNTELPLKEGFFWLDRNVIKCFDKQGNIYNVYRVNVDNDLNVNISISKRRYTDVNTIDVASWEEIIQLNIPRLQQLEKDAIKLIEEKLDKFKNYTPMIPVSMGKDSIVTCHLVRQVLPNAKAIFNNSSLDCADTYKMAKQFPNCEIMSPKTGFYQFSKKYQMIPTRFARFCCKLFKVGEMVHQLDKNHPYLFFMGMRNEESPTRSGYQDEWKNESEWGNTEWQSILPIRTWTELDVWLYILWKNLDINAKYKKGYARCGCVVACPYYAKSTWVLDEYWYSLAYQRWQNILREDFITNNKWIIMNCTIKEYTQKAWCGGTFRDNPTDEVIQEFADYNNLDFDIAKRYFDRFCANGCLTQKKKPKKIKTKEELGMNMKLHGRNVEKFYCKQCLQELHSLTDEKWDEYVASFKADGCDLF